MIVVDPVLSSERVTVVGVKGKAILYLGRTGTLHRLDMQSDVLEVPRCTIRDASAVAFGPPAVVGTTNAFLRRLVEALAGGRRIERAVFWPSYIDIYGNIVSEPAIGIIMFDEPGWLAPTPKQWAAAVAHLRILERHAR